MLATAHLNTHETPHYYHSFATTQLASQAISIPSFEFLRLAVFCSTSFTLTRLCGTSPHEMSLGLPLLPGLLSVLASDANESFRDNARPL